MVIEPRIPETEPRDVLDRPMRDLRISVTDRCNFRCTYCMPRELFGSDHAFLPRSELLSFEEITRVARVFSGLGVRKLRLTGGEPMVRKDLPRLIEQLAGIEGIDDISLTTNGSLLDAASARRLHDAGLRRITVSLDSLDDATFARINDVQFPVSRVLEAIDHAAGAGLRPVKVNMVVIGGVNDADVVPMAAHFRGSGHILRYIEYMDVGNTNGWRMDDVVTAADIAAELNRHWPIEPASPNYRGEVARRWRYRDGAGEIGIISSVSQPFCDTCTRARLSAEGRLYTCLFAADGFDLRGILRQGADDRELADAIAGVWRRREDRYSELRTRSTVRAPRIEMSYIGG